MTEIDPISSESPLWDVRGWRRLTVHEDPPLVAARQEFLAWLAEVPEPHRVDLGARLRSELDHAHLSARLELFVQHYFRSSGWAVRIHPEVTSSSNRPDFLMEKGDDVLLVECKSVLDQPPLAQQDQRLRQLADNAGKKLGRAVILNPLSDLPPNIPARRIRSWIDRQEIPDNTADLLEFDFWDDYQGQHYGIRAVVPSLDDAEEPLTGVHGLMSQVQTVTTARQLRVALQEKATKYGRLDLPYVIAVSLETKFHRLKHEVDALLGDRMVVVPRHDPTNVTETRNQNGFFTAPRNDSFGFPQVSAVLVYRFKWLDEGHEHRMHIYHNPFAARPIDLGFFPVIPQWIQREENTMGWINGEPESS